jgi:hypothetical protein
MTIQELRLSVFSSPISLGPTIPSSLIHSSVSQDKEGSSVYSVSGLVIGRSDEALSVTWPVR